MQLAVISGIALIAAEFLRSLHDVRRVLRVLCWGWRILRGGRRPSVLDQSGRRAVPARPAGLLAQRHRPWNREPRRTEPSEWDVHLPDRARSRGGDAAAARDLSCDLRHQPESPATLGAGRADRAHDPGVGVALGGHRGRRGCGGTRGPDAGAPAAFRALRFAIRPGRGIHDRPWRDPHTHSLSSGPAQPIPQWPPG